MLIQSYNAEFTMLQVNNLIRGFDNQRPGVWEGELRRPATPIIQHRLEWLFKDVLEDPHLLFQFRPPPCVFINCQEDPIAQLYPRICRISFKSSNANNHSTFF